MKIIIPMAGMGKRLRPHTLTVPKPLFPIAGKPIVERLVEDLVHMYQGTIAELAFVVGDFGPAVEAQLQGIGLRLGIPITLHHQAQALGTAHAVHCAASALDGEVIIAFADTLFTADFTLDREADGVIWVKTVSDPRNFGVVVLDKEGYLQALVEKPDTFVSDLAIIGIYYIRQGPALLAQLEYLLQHNIRSKGEYQLTDALDAMRQQGARLKAGEVQLWMDCGNKEAVLDTNQQVLALSHPPIPASCSLTHAQVVQPCYLGDNVVLENAVVGPFASLGAGSTVRNAVVSHSILMEGARVENACLHNTILGRTAVVQREPESLNLGDFSVA